MRELAVLFVIATFLITGGHKIGFAIDPIFSQFYANPLYLNPAFAGSQKCTRMNLNYRNQPYPGFGTFSTYSFSIDNYFESLSGGLGINVLKDDQGGLLTNIRAGITYAFHGKLSRQWFISFGVQASYVNYQLNWNDLVFPDQHSPFQPSLSVSNEIQPGKLNSHAADFAAGILLYNKNLFAGASIFHLNQPQIEFFIEQKLPLKYTFHFGYDISLFTGRRRHAASESVRLSPNVILQSQDGFNIFNYGMYATFSPIITGLWFRHNLKHPNSLIFMLGIKQEKYLIGYSYDYSLSGFSGIGSGAHEISVLLNFNCPGQNMKYRIINCPTF